MANVLWTKIQGWGVVSSEDSDIGFVTANNAAGTAVLVIGTTTTTLTSFEAGSEVYITNLPGLVDGFYTATTIFALSGSTFVYIKGDPANFSIVNGSTSGKIRIEDHYKISTGVPDWVTGINAFNRWYTAMVNVSPTLGSTIKINGGIGKTDGLTVGHNALYLGLDKIRWDVMNTDSTVLLKTKIYDQTEDTGWIATGAPWMDSYSNPNTAPTLGTYEPVFVSSEAIRVDSATPVGVTYTFDLTRGLLRTTKEQHIYGELFFQGFTTPAGKRLWLHSTLETDTCYYEAEELFNGLITGIEYDEGGALQEIAVSDDMLVTKKRPSYGFGEPQAVGFSSVSNFREKILKIDQQFVGYYWQWVIVDGVACRIKLDQVEQRYFEADTNNDNYGRVLSYQKLQTGVIDNGKINAIILEQRSSVEEYNYWAKPPENEGTSIGRTGDGTLIVEFPEDYYIYGMDQRSDGTYIGSARINWENVEENGLELKIGHVFEGNEFAENPTWDSLDSGIFPVERWVRANPVEIILQILLTKWGDSLNTFVYDGETWDFDVLPAELGLSLNPEQINFDSFLRAANFFDENEIYLYNAYITSKDTQTLEKWLENNILEPFLISLTVGGDSKINCTLLAQQEYNTALNTLNNTALFANAGEPSEISYRYDSTLLVSKIVHEFERGWLPPDDPESKKTVNYLFGIDGASRQLLGLEAEELKSKPQAAPAFADSDLPALGEYFGPYLTAFRTIIPVFTCQVHKSFAGNCGDYIYVDLANLPDARGGDDSNLQGVGLITKRKRDVLHQIDELEVAILNTQRLDVLRGWAASGKLDTVASDTVFDLLPSEYIPTRFSDYDEDAEAFNANDQVLLYDENFTLRSTDGAATISSVSGNTITLSAAWKSGGFDITPASTDIMLHYNQASQTTETQTEFAWIFTSRSNQQKWQ